MEDLRKLREENKDLEQRQNALLMSFIKNERKRFEFADVSQQLAYEKNLEDTMVINDALTTWLQNPKLNAKSKAELNDLLVSLWRVMTYSNNLETITKTAVSKYVSTERRNDELVSEKKTLELRLHQIEQTKNKEIDALKKEIEFLNKS